jgi:rRNA pseudouridine-1189 N-methylase Emg1 (Nep1/Mra1 family)
MRNDSILVLGGLALILFFASSGSRTVAEIEGRVLSLDQIYEEWAPRNKQNNITLLMEAFLYKSQKLRALDGENLKSMTKKDLLDIITTMAKGPVAILEKLSHSVKTSHARDRELAEDFL